MNCDSPHRNGVHVPLMHRLYSLLLASGLLLANAVGPATPPIVAAERPTAITSIANAPYSQLFYTGVIYAVKDRDYAAGNPSIGVSTLWSWNPKAQALQVAVRYCLQDAAIEEPETYLTGVTLLDHERSLLELTHVVKTTPNQTRVLRPGYLTYDYADPFWRYPFGWSVDRWFDSYDDIQPVYVPPRVCNAGFVRFDLAPEASTITQLPNQTLQMRLTFSNGETQTWRLGKGTVQALKALVSLQ